MSCQRILCEEFVNCCENYLQYDNLSGMIPDRLSYYIKAVLIKRLTFHKGEGVKFFCG